MAISLGTLVVDIIAKTGGFVEGMSKARVEARNASKEIQNSFSELGDAAAKLLGPFGEIGGAIGESLGSVGNTMRSVSQSLAPLIGELGLVGAGIAGVTGAVAALGAAGAGIALFAANGANELFELSEKSGVSVEALSSLSYAAKQSGVSAETLANGLEKMSKSAFTAATAPEKAINAYKRLGVSVVDASGQIRPTQDILEDLAGKFSGLSNSVTRVALAQQIFGKGGAELLPFLNQGKEGIAALVAEADELGITLSGKTAEGAHVFEQTMAKIQAALTGASNVVLTVMLPSMQALSDFFVNEIKDPSGIFRELGTTIAEILVPAFKVLASAIAVAVTIGDYFVAALGGGIQFISQQVIGLSNALGDLKTGNFREAGNELRSQFQEGLANFTKGIEDETSKADARLTKFFASTWFGADFSTPEKKRQTDTIVDISQKKQQQTIDTSIKRGPLNIPNITPPDLRTTQQQFDEVREGLQTALNGGINPAVLQMGQQALDDFYSDFKSKNAETVEAINAKYDEMAAHFDGLLTLNAISQKQFNQLSVDLETSRVAAIQRLQVKQGTNLAASFADAFNKIVSEGDQLAEHLADAVGNAIHGLSDQLAKLAVTGKANFGQIGKSFEESVVKSGTDKLFSSATKGIGNLFGVHFSGAKPKGTANDPIWTRNADGKVADAAHSLGQHFHLGNLSSGFQGLFKNLGGGFGSLFKSFGSLFSGGGIGSIFGSLFGGFRAGGGSTDPGKAYVVGEDHPEIFVPDRPGQIVPRLAAAGAGGHTIVNHISFNGVRDHDSFKASKDQILNNLASAVGRAVSRR